MTAHRRAVLGAALASMAAVGAAGTVAHHRLHPGAPHPRWYACLTDDPELGLEEDNELVPTDA